MLKEKPSGVIVYGDTNSTLAGAIAASKMHIPVIHIEAGLRSFNKEMPEEINRVLCDHVSTLLFTPTKAGYCNLIAEGFKENTSATLSAGTSATLSAGASDALSAGASDALSAGVKPYTINNPKIYHCGDVMYDNCLYFGKRAENRPFMINGTDVTDSNYVLVTIHRDSNTDDPKRLSALFKSIIAISDDFNISVVLPLHPRTANLFKQNLDPGVYRDVKSNEHIKIIPAVSFLDMYTLEKGAKLIMTDSGGVQKESFFFRKPCIILRPETEWVELVENGNAILADANIEKITSAFSELTAKTNFTYPALFGDGKSAFFICEKILETLSYN